MLFVLVMEAINAMISFADDHGFLAPLLPEVSRCRTSLYADDMVLFITPVAGDIAALRELLTVFGNAAGLFTNWSKSVATPIRCSPHHYQLLQAGLGCLVTGFPCLYLGIPLTIAARLTHAEEQPIIDAIARRIPAWKGHLLNLAGRATLVSTTLSAIPTHVAIVTALSAWAIGEIDKRRRAFLWAGSDRIAGGNARSPGRSPAGPGG